MQCFVLGEVKELCLQRSWEARTSPYAAKEEGGMESVEE